MAHTDRDDARWFWSNHFNWHKGEPECLDLRYRVGWRSSDNVCWCNTLPQAWMWASPYRYEMGIPSSWNRDQRKIERGKLRNQIQRARAGHIDWDDLPSGEGKMYRRPYYW